MAKCFSAPGTEGVTVASATGVSEGGGADV
jgi:hypothetical protein